MQDVDKVIRLIPEIQKILGKSFIYTHHLFAYDILRGDANFYFKVMESIHSKINNGVSLKTLNVKIIPLLDSEYTEWVCSKFDTTTILREGDLVFYQGIHNIIFVNYVIDKNRMLDFRGKEQVILNSRAKYVVRPRELKKTLTLKKAMRYIERLT